MLESGGREGREPERLHPPAEDHEEMLNWHLEISAGAGQRGPDSASSHVTLPKASLKYSEPSAPKSGAWCGITNLAVPHQDLCVHHLVLAEIH